MVDALPIVELDRPIPVYEEGLIFEDGPECFDEEGNDICHPPPNEDEFSFDSSIYEEDMDDSFWDDFEDDEDMDGNFSDFESGFDEYGDPISNNGLDEYGDPISDDGYDEYGDPISNDYDDYGEPISSDGYDEYGELISEDDLSGSS